MVNIAKLHKNRIPTSIHDAASMLQRIELENEEYGRTVVQLSTDIILNRFEQGRITEEAIQINSRSLNGEQGSTYGLGLIDALAQKAGIGSRTLRNCHALYKRAGTREAFYEQLGRWKDGNINISWNHCVNWANKALPASKEKAQDKIDKEIKLIERTLIKAKDRLLSVKEQSDEWEPERADELVGLAQAVVETIYETQQVRVEGLPLDKPLDKLVRKTDDRYLVFIRTRPCSNCGAAAPSEPHHVARGGMGTKGSDLFTIAICRACHDQIHQIGERTFWQDYNVWQIIAQTLSDYIDTRLT